MLGGAVAGVIAGLAGVTDAVPHGGPIVALLGAVGNVMGFFAAILAGTVVTAVVAVALKTMYPQSEDETLDAGALIGG